VIVPAGQRHPAQPLGINTLRLIGLVEIEAISRRLARRQRTNYGHKGGENEFHCDEWSKFSAQCQRASRIFHLSTRFFSSFEK
jgi:hypothetical protein